MALRFHYIIFIKRSYHKKNDPAEREEFRGTDDELGRRLESIRMEQDVTEVWTEYIRMLQ